MKTTIATSMMLVLALVASAIGTGGCELVAYVDRSALADEDAGATAPEAGATPRDGGGSCSSPAECPASESECIEPTCDGTR